MKKSAIKTVLFLFATALLLVLSSCNANELDVPYEYDEEKAVSLRVLQSLDTRGTSRPIPDSEAVLFNSGDIYFVTSGGLIIQHYTIVAAASGTPTDIEAGIINRNDLNTGVTIHSVPGNVTRVVVVGNTSTTPSPPNITAVGNRLIDVIDQHNAWNVNMFGEATLTHTAGDYSPPPPVGTGNRIYRGVVQLAPTVSRFEIAEITGTGMIQSFTIDGIFMDRFYRRAAINGVINTASLHSGLQEPNNFTGTSHSFDTHFGIHDWFSGGLAASSATSLSVSPDSETLFNGVFIDDVWSYQVFATDHNEAVSPVATTSPPRIIIRLSDVVLTDGTHLGTQFLTVRGFRLQTGDLLEGIRSSHVYHIASLVFDERNLDYIPNRNLIDVNIQITLAVWNEETIIHPGFRQPSPQSVSIGCNENHIFTLGAAVTGDCFGGAITYLWQQSTDNVIWTAASGVNNLLGYQTPVLTQNTYFRRVATCACGTSIVSHSALVSLPPRTPAVDIPYSVVIGGIEWATRNVDLSTPTGFTVHPGDRGMLFQWRQNVGWSAIDPALLRWNPSMQRWDTGTWNTNIADGAWEPTADPCPEDWRVPTVAEFESLLSNSIGSGNNRGQWLTQDEAAMEGYGCQAGRLFGTGDNQVFFPAVGFRNSNGALLGVGTSGLYWSHSATGAAGLALTSTLTEVDGNTTTTQGFFIRCVRDTPLTLTANNQVTAFVNVMYDFQHQALQSLVTEGTTATAWQWQVSTSRTGTYINIQGATAATWTLPVDFIHNSAYNGIDELFFRVLMIHSDGSQSITSNDDALGIRFIRTTVSGQGSGFRSGFGIDNGVRYAVINRARHLGDAANPNTIRVALLNIGATDTDGIGLGDLYQWGRITEGHQQIEWVNNPTTGVTELGAGTSLTVPFTSTWGTFDLNTGQAVAGTHIGRFITSNSGWSTSFAAFHDFWGSTLTYRHNAPNSLSEWTSRGQGNNPCPANWYVPSRWDWSDMHSGTGTNTTTPNGVYGTFNNNNWEWRDTQANAAGGAILTNAHNNAAVFLPSAGSRSLTDGTRSSVTSGFYWSSTHFGVPFRFGVNNNYITIGQSSPAHGMSVRCVR